MYLLPKYSFQIGFGSFSFFVPAFLTAPDHFFTPARLRSSFYSTQVSLEGPRARDVAMFSFRRKSKQEPESPRIRTSPSLPELNSQGIPWPEDLVDINAIRQEPVPEAVPTQGAAKTSFQGPHPDVPIPFHKPFRPSTGKRNDGPISSLYMTGPPTTYDTKVPPRSAGRYSQRRARAPPTFNLMVSCDMSSANHSTNSLIFVP